RFLHERLSYACRHPKPFIISAIRPWRLAKIGLLWKQERCDANQTVPSGFGDAAQLKEAVAIFDIDVDVEHDSICAVDQLCHTEDLPAGILEDAANLDDRVVDLDSHFNGFRRRRGDDAECLAL